MRQRKNSPGAIPEDQIRRFIQRKLRNIVKPDVAALVADTLKAEIAAMTATPKGRAEVDVQFTLRLPAHLHRVVTDQAIAAGQTLNKWMIGALLVALDDH